MIKRGHSSKAQVWVETVIYTLIGLTIIGLLLAAAKPKIDNIKDSSLIDQAIDSLGKIDATAYGVITAPGNRRIFNLRVGKGDFVIDAENDKIYWNIFSSFQYSEENVNVKTGVVNVKTTKGNPWNVNLEIAYNNFDIRYDNQSVLKNFQESSEEYSFYLENLGVVNDKIVINIKEI